MNFDEFKRKAETDMQFKHEFEDTYQQLKDALTRLKCVNEKVIGEKLIELRQQFCDFFVQQGFKVDDTSKSIVATYACKKVSFTINGNHAEIYGLLESGCTMVVDVEIEVSNNPYCPHWQIKIGNKNLFLGNSEMDMNTLENWIKRLEYKDITVGQEVKANLLEHIKFVGYVADNYANAPYKFVVFEPDRIPEFIEGQFKAKGSSLKELLSDE